MRAKAYLGAMALVAAMAVGASAQESKEKAQRPNVTPAEAREIFQAFQEIVNAVENESKTTASKPDDDVLKRLNRPARTVTKTTLDPATLDSMLEKGLAESKTIPAKVAGDEVFVRRVYLDVTGKLPTPEQVVAFVRDKDKDKRAELVERLLASPEYAQNWARYWREAMQYHVTAPQPRFVNLPKMEEWLTEQFGKNSPWDEVVREMLTSDGSTAEVGAAVFTAAQGAQPVEMAGEVSRLFLGVQIQCAQCHDHPSDPWKREQFHEFAAFFAGTQARPDRTNLAFNVTTRRGVPRYSMPDLKDPQKSIAVAPKFFLASAEEKVPANLNAAERRALVASYVTGQDNPWFAKAFVNRLWYSLIGESFYTPIDDLGPAREARSPEVIDALAAEWAKGGYDVRWLFRTILNTKVYQRESRATNTSAGKVAFASNCASRLRADQIFDALAQALNVKLDQPPGRGRGAQAKAQGQGIAALGMRNRNFGPRFLFGVLFGVDPSTPNEDVLGTIPQALFLMNSPLINRAIQANGPDSMLGPILRENPDNLDALTAVYLKVLARRPNQDEVETCGRYLASVGNRREAFEDIVWGLVNSTEFVSRR